VATASAAPFVLFAGAQRELVVDRGAHADRAVFADAVEGVDPGRDPGAGLGLGGEALQTAQLEFQRGVLRLALLR
jgi:hypothetical protein